jgi:hypothetical protein
MKNKIIEMTKKQMMEQKPASNMLLSEIHYMSDYIKECDNKVTYNQFTQFLDRLIKVKRLWDKILQEDAEEAVRIKEKEEI